MYAWNASLSYELLNTSPDILNYTIGFYMNSLKVHQTILHPSWNCANIAIYTSSDVYTHCHKTHSFGEEKLAV